MMCDSIISSGIPMREWCFVVEHMTLVDSMTSYSTSDKSKTIFEAVYGVAPNVDSFPPIGCFTCRLEEIKDKTDKKLGIRNTVGTFVGFATLKNCYGGEILTGKNTHVVGNLQMVYDSLYIPFKGKSASNPRWETHYNVLERVNKKLLTGNFDSGNNAEKDETSVEENSDTFSDLVPNIGQEDIVVSIDDDSSDHDVVDETVKEMHDILVKIPPFNPLHSDSPTGRRVDNGNARSRQGGYGCSRSRSLQLFGGSRDGWSTSAYALKVGGNQLQKASTTSFSEANCELQN
jgi:hypothetical protein